jgi:RimJ/RimL family protein N-acetyltransferase
MRLVTSARFECRDFTPNDEIDSDELNNFLNCQRERPRLNYQLAIVEKSSRKIVGITGVLTQGLYGGKALFVLHLNEAIRGRYAVAFEIGYAILEWSFEALSLNELQVRILHSDKTSERLAQYAGFIQTKTSPTEDISTWTLSYGQWEERATKFRETKNSKR